MKKTILFLCCLFLVFSCKNEENNKYKVAKNNSISVETGKQLFEQNNCQACHLPNTKVVGPSLQEIAKIYKEQNGNLVAFLKEEAPAIVDVSQAETMKINLQITKTMQDADLQAIEMYILNHQKK